MSTASPNTSDYDEVPYASHPFPQTHPDRLAVVGRLFGMTPADVRTARVLELGCASGGNLLPLAVAYPEAEFIGVDLSQRQIDAGRQTVRALGLTNIELHHRDIAAVGPDVGQFDYILCHGVFSWAPAHVRDRILGIAAEQLAPQGIAYVSYNTYPGWHLRGTIRDIMCFHARRYTTPEERVGHARALLDLLVKAVPTQDNAYGLLLKDEFELLRDKADFYVLHEHLEQVNEPMYFHQFMEHAQRHGLAFLAEAELGAMSLAGYPSSVADVLRRLASDLIELEQYFDFLRNRMFRQTLLCRAEVAIDRQIATERLQGTHVVCPLRRIKHEANVTANEQGGMKQNAIASATEPDPTTGPSSATGAGTLAPAPRDPATATYVGPRGKLTTSEPLLIALLDAVTEAWPAALPIERLCDQMLASLSRSSVQDAERTKEQRQAVLWHVLDGYIKGFFQLWTHKPVWATQAGERPLASPLARLQSQTDRVVSNLRHEMVPLDDLARPLLPLLDGHRTHRQLVEALLDLVTAGRLTVRGPEGLAHDTLSARPILQSALQDALAALASNALVLN